MVLSSTNGPPLFVFQFDRAIQEKYLRVQEPCKNLQVLPDRYFNGWSTFSQQAMGGIYMPPGWRYSAATHKVRLRPLTTLQAFPGIPEPDVIPE